MVKNLFHFTLTCQACFSNSSLVNIFLNFSVICSNIFIYLRVLVSYTTVSSQQENP